MNLIHYSLLTINNRSFGFAVVVSALIITWPIAVEIIKTFLVENYTRHSRVAGHVIVKKITRHYSNVIAWIFKIREILVFFRYAEIQDNDAIVHGQIISDHRSHDRTKRIKTKQTLGSVSRVNKFLVSKRIIYERREREKIKGTKRLNNCRDRSIIRSATV